MKKVIPLILAITMVFSIGSMTALANNTPIMLGDFNYIFDNSNKTATVVGATYALTSDEITLPSEVKYNGTTYTVIGIGESAFSNRNDITSVIIPSTVTSIGKRAFEKSLSLQSVGFAADSQLLKIDTDAFSDCIKLDGIVLPLTLQTLGKGAFYNCSSLTSITIPESLSSIEDFTFCGCVGLSSIEIPPNVIAIGSRAFFRCTDLKAVTFAPGSKLKTIEYEAFCACTDIVNLIFPDSLSVIESSAFSGCYRLKELVFTGKKLTLGQHVFDNYNLDLLPATIPVPSDSLSTIFFAGTHKEWENVLADAGINLTLSPENKKLTVVCTDDLQPIAQQSSSSQACEPTSTPTPVKAQVVVEPAPTTQTVSSVEVPTPAKGTATVLSPAPTHKTVATQTSTEQSTASTQTASAEQSTVSTQTTSSDQSTASTQTTAPTQSTVATQTPIPATVVAIPSPTVEMAVSVDLSSPVQAVTVVETVPTTQVVVSAEVPTPIKDTATPLPSSPLQAAVITDLYPPVQFATPVDTPTPVQGTATVVSPASPVGAAVLVDLHPSVQIVNSVEVSNPVQGPATVETPAPLQSTTSTQTQPSSVQAPSLVSTSVHISSAQTTAPVQGTTSTHSTQTFVPTPVQSTASTQTEDMTRTPVQTPSQPQPKAGTEATTQTETKTSTGTRVSPSMRPSSFAADQYSFWKGVADRISHAPGNTTVDINAGGYTEMSAQVMDRLRENPTVSLTIHWSDDQGCHTLTFPAGKALAPEAGRVSYFLGDLEHSQAGRTSTSSLAISNPSTGGPQVTTSNHLAGTIAISVLFTLALAGLYITRKSKKTS